MLTLVNKKHWKLNQHIRKRRCDKTLKTSVVEVEKRTNRVSIDSEVCVLPLSSFVLEPDYADIAKGGCDISH